MMKKELISAALGPYIQVAKLPLDGLVEIECIASLKD